MSAYSYQMPVAIEEPDRLTYKKNLGPCERNHDVSG